MPTNRALFFLVFAGVVAAQAALSGCATVETADGDRLRMTSAEYRAYVETVFRAQNRVASDLAFALEDAAPGESSELALAAAEARLLEECASLNEIATRRRDDERTGLRRGVAAARAAPRCEAATRAAEGVLERAAAR